MKRARLLAPLLVFLSALALGACRSVGPAGHLVIAGGALSSDNAEVYGTILELAGPDATVGVLPTASGEWERSGQRARETFDGHAGAAVAEVIAITRDDLDAALDPEVAAGLREHEVLWFTGGSQSRILAAFRPDGVDTPAYGALLDVLDAGGVVAGSSAGAAMMSDPMVYRGSSAAALAHGVGGVEVGPGMGLFPFGLTGQHFLARGRVGRMLVALEAAGIERGYGVAEDSAIHVDLGSGLITTLGPRALCLVDVAELERSQGAWRGVRLSLLGGGATVDGRTGETRSHADHHPTEPATRASVEHEVEGGAWDPHVIRALIEVLALGPATEVSAPAGELRLVLRADARTRFFLAPSGDLATLTAHDVLLDLVPAER